MHLPGQQEILVVDDDPMDRMLIFRSLRELELGCSLVHVEDGYAALNYLRQPRAPNHPIVLVLLDLKMPKLDGLAVLRQLQDSSILSQTPIVVMSSSAITEDIEAAYALGARAYVTKPIRHDDFRAAVRSLGEFWITHNRVSGLGTS